MRNLIRSITAAWGLSVCFSLGASGQTPAPQPTFEAATVKRAVPREGGAEASTSGDMVSLRNTTLKNALARAFQVVSGNQVVGPAWITTERYDIDAKAPEGTPPQQILTMLAALLTERFHLTLRHENRIMREYALTVGKGPLKVRKAEDLNPPQQDVLVEGKDGRREALHFSMAALARRISLILREPAVDVTNQAGSFDFPLDYSTEETGRSSDPSIFTIVEGLGLKLQPQMAPLHVIVVEAGDKTPAPN